MQKKWQQTKKQWKKKRRTWSFSNTMLGLSLAFLFIPLFVIVFYSFNASKDTSFTNFSFIWYEKLIFEDKDLINFISILLFEDGELDSKVLELYKNEEILRKIKTENLGDFSSNFETFIVNVQGANRIKDFTRDEYLKSINYFEKIYGSYKVEDFYSFYKNALLEIENHT